MTIEERDKINSLLYNYSLWLEKNGYMDVDWRAEEPFAINSYLNENLTEKKPFKITKHFN